MGEKSLTNGITGETIVNELLNLIGWKSTPINESLQCIYSEKHKNDRTIKGKSTHGSDSFYIYKSPFFTGQLNHVVISSKYTENSYPDENSKTLNTQFSKHFNDLSNTIECYSRSTLKNDNAIHFKNIDYAEIFGILFWTSDNEEYLTKSIHPKIVSEYLKDLNYNTIYLIDSARSSFLYKSIQIIENNYSKNAYKSSFYYIDTGNNPSDKNKKFKGEFLPIQLLISDIQLFLLEKDDKRILAMIVKDNFTIESVNRIFGLAHNISKGLAKINIHFPNYSSSKHGNDVKRVKRGFQNSNIIDSINILSYNDDFRSLSNDNNTLSLPSDIDDEVDLNHNQILPYGNEIRDLLSRSQISITEMNKLLKNKGVYLSEPSKENIIPILSSILLSPKEFDFLKENQKTNDDKEKRRSNPPLQLTTNMQNKTLITALPESFDLNKIAKKEFANYEFHNASLSFEMIDNNPNKVKANYKITKYENNKIWFESQNEYYGSVTLELNQDKLEMKSKSIHTSKETELISDLIKKEIVKEFRKKDFIDKSTIEKKILMDDFSNEERIPFFINFTDTLNQNLTFENIINMDIEIDENEKLPSDSQIKWMEDKIKRFKFDGNKIEDIDLITQNKNHKYLKCWGMIAEYKFDSKEGKGNCKINFSFQKSGKNEFEIHIIPKINFKSIETCKTGAENFIMDTLDNLKLNKYQIIMEKKNV